MFKVTQLISGQIRFVLRSDSTLCKSPITSFPESFLVFCFTKFDLLKRGVAAAVGACGSSLRFAGESSLLAGPHGSPAFPGALG